MVDADSSSLCYWGRLEQVLTHEQKEQLAQLILERLATGWGGLELEFENHHIKAFLKIESVRARRPKIEIDFPE